MLDAAHGNTSRSPRLGKTYISSCIENGCATSANFQPTTTRKKQEESDPQFQGIAQVVEVKW